MYTGEGEFGSALITGFWCSLLILSILCIFEIAHNKKAGFKLYTYKCIIIVGTFTKTTREYVNKNCATVP